MRSLRRGVAANMAGQIYSVGINVLMVPAYIHFMGMEAYGLVGFFVALQTWFALLDAGVSPTLIRELSRYRAGELTTDAVWRFIRSAECLFAVLGVVCGGLVVVLRGTVVSDWLRLETIDPLSAAWCVAMMGLMLGLRWLSSLYRSGLIGMERFTLLNACQVGLSTVRSVVVLAVLAFVSNAVTTFFTYQACLAVAELLLLRQLFVHTLPGGGAIGPSMAAFRPVLRFAGAMAALSIIWGVLAQTDRLILAHVISMSAFGEYSLATVAAGAVAILATPFTQALQPRLVYLAASGANADQADLYRRGTQVLSWILGVVAGAAIFVGEQVLFAWTGTPEVARRIAGLLALYAAGNVFWALSSLVFQLQYASGNVRRHVVGSLALAVLWGPLIVVMAMRYGAQGAAWTWLAGNSVFFFAWMLGTQRSMMPGLTASWLLRDVMAVLLGCFAAYALIGWLVPPLGRWATLLMLVGAALGAGAVGCLCGSRLRPMAAAAWRRVMRGAAA